MSESTQTVDRIAAFESRAEDKAARTVARFIAVVQHDPQPHTPATRTMLQQWIVSLMMQAYHQGAIDTLK